MFFKFALYSLSLSVFLFIDRGQTLEVESIRGGSKATKCQFPYQVSIYEAGDSLCSGSIIHKSFVITAAHCIVDGDKTVNMKNLTVLAVSTNLRISNRLAQSVKVQRVYFHPEYSSTTLYANIAVLRLEHPLKLGPKRCAGVAKLPNKSDRYVDQQAVLTGFGYENETSRSGDLTYMNATIVSNEECQNQYSMLTERYNEKKVLIQDSFLCAFATDATFKEAGQCKGDGGGPLIIPSKKPLLVGIASQRRTNCDEAAAPSIYTRVSSFMPLIREALKDDSNLQVESSEHIKVCDIFNTDEGNGSFRFSFKNGADCRRGFRISIPIAKNKNLDINFGK